MKSRLSSLDQACYFCLLGPAIGLGLLLALVMFRTPAQAPAIYLTALPIAYLLGAAPAFLTGMLSGRLPERRGKSLLVAALGALIFVLTILALLLATDLTRNPLPGTLAACAIIGFITAFSAYWLVNKLPALNL
ncbi:hypothetical protein [Enterobacillus tribolii]|uniref:Inner membrane protein CbrB n=1 Tax=Enterobacillus tribolii TaxID=1487935 RepID=A0A370R4N7_9GAMM|nr:hypothetical protein [Enterobacillus tribolii]MBW7983331.1 hypothetical protein [Enterobacillus tribolii]RDK97388.1 hypothetical protein C8D90_101836 [Enterobacillus tribolii]